MSQRQGPPARERSAGRWSMGADALTGRLARILAGLTSLGAALGVLAVMTPEPGPEEGLCPCPSMAAPSMESSAAERPVEVPGSTLAAPAPEKGTRKRPPRREDTRGAPAAPEGAGPAAPRGEADPEDGSAPGPGEEGAGELPIRLELRPVQGPVIEAPEGG